MTPRCLQQSSEGSTALWGRLVVEKLPTSLEKKKRKLMLKDIYCYKLEKFREV